MKQQTLTGSVELINGRAKMSCRAEGRPEIIVDYTPPLGDGEGYTSLELLLFSLGSCLASTVKFVLTGPMGKTVPGIRAAVSGVRRTEHPTCFENILIGLEVDSPDTSREELEGVIRSAEEKICPVYAMVKGQAEIVIESRITEAV